MSIYSPFIFFTIYLIFKSTSNEVESEDTEMALVEAAKPDANVENQQLGSE